MVNADRRVESPAWSMTAMVLSNICSPSMSSRKMFLNEEEKGNDLASLRFLMVNKPPDSCAMIDLMTGEQVLAYPRQYSSLRAGRERERGIEVLTSCLISVGISW